MSRAKTCRAKFFNRFVIFTLSLGLFVSSALAAPPKYVTKEYGALGIFKEIAKLSKLAKETKERPKRDPKVVTQFVVENNYAHPDGLLRQHYKFKPITTQPRRLSPALKGSAGIAIPLSDFDLSDEPYNPEGDGPTPRGGTPNFGSCPGGTGTLVAEVLAIQQTYGANGPQVPARLDCEFVGGLREALNGDEDLWVGMQPINMPIPAEASEIMLWGRMAYPTFDDPYMSQEFSSDHVTNSMILVDGNNYLQMAAAKGVQNAYGSQQSVAAILGPNIMNATTGDISLPPNQAIQLFELGTTNSASAAYDMQDLVLLLTTNCDIPQPVTLRDSIGIDTSLTDGNKPIGTNYKVVSSWFLPPVRVTVPQQLKLTTLTMVVSPRTTTQINFDQYDYNISVWDSETAFNANPLGGNRLSLHLAVPSTGPEPFGFNFWGDQNWKITFDISSYNLVFAADQNLIIGMQGETSSASYGRMGIQETDLSGDPESVCTDTNPPPNCLSLQGSSYQIHDARLGVSVMGLSQ